MNIDQIIRTRRKTIALVITPDGKLVVRAPLYATDNQIREAVDRHREWIRAKQHETSQYRTQYPSKTYQEGEQFWYLGQLYPLKISLTARTPLKLSDGFILSQKVLTKAETVFTTWYRTQAQQVIVPRVLHLAAPLGYYPERIRISSARTRWGSCSARGTLSFAWRLVMAPLPVIDYVIVHELVHLVHHNHSRVFWDQVRQITPDYKQHIAWLKSYGSQLTLPG